jgi:sugar transferase EpsL
MTSFYHRRGKRLFDVVGATAVLVVSSPLQLAVATIVRNQMGSPILFKQQRPGLKGQPFTLLKFRSMLPLETELMGRRELESERITRLGKLLRISSIDELPELWNVLKGDMSLVGPRPLLMEYLDRYTTEQSRRHNMKPGITGWAQVNGRNALTWDQKFTLDLWYIDNASFFLDTRILWLTFKTVLKHSGISAAGHSTMPEFNP